jgi:hypothetical protein
MQLVFCSVSCWDSHVATLRHRDAWAVEERAPSRAEWLAARGDAAPAGSPAHRTEAPTAPLRHVVGAPPPRAPVALSTSVAASSSPSSAPRPTVFPAPVLSNAFERDVLIVVSKLKKYIKDRSGMNTSDAVADMLGDHVRLICDQAIHAAAQDGRKTVLDRDVPQIPRR